ncbi:MAG: hydrogenase accessory protein HypB, partial [Aquificaceae bacterium]|nr:hydrogenase accessory protein HypB [Aquificaceae bacterium]
MCQDCGCSTNQEHAKRVEVQVFKKVLERNDLQAEENREHFEQHGVFAINLMSSPGSGKTS